MDTPIFRAFAEKFGVVIPNGDEPAMTHIPSEVDGYVYTDPVDDPAYPRITGPSFDAPDRFPDDWGSRPTERDQAAIQAGNA